MNRTIKIILFFIVSPSIGLSALGVAGAGLACVGVLAIIGTISSSNATLVSTITSAPFKKRDAYTSIIPPVDQLKFLKAKGVDSPPDFYNLISTPIQHIKKSELNVDNVIDKKLIEQTKELMLISAKVNKNLDSKTITKLSNDMSDSLRELYRKNAIKNQENVQSKYKDSYAAVKNELEGVIVKDPNYELMAQAWSDVCNNAVADGIIENYNFKEDVLTLVVVSGLFELYKKNPEIIPVDMKNTIEKNTTTLEDIKNKINLGSIDANSTNKLFNKVKNSSANDKDMKLLASYAFLLHKYPTIFKSLMKETSDIRQDLFTFHMTTIEQETINKAYKMLYEQAQTRNVEHSKDYLEFYINKSGNISVVTGSVQKINAKPEARHKSERFELELL